MFGWFDRFRPEMSEEDKKFLRSMAGSKAYVKDGVFYADADRAREALQKLHENTRHLVSNDYTDVRISKKTLLKMDQHARDRGIRRDQVFDRAIELLDSEYAANRAAEALKKD